MVRSLSHRRLADDPPRPAFDDVIIPQTNDDAPEEGRKSRGGIFLYLGIGFGMLMLIGAIVAVVGANKPVRRGRTRRYDDDY